MRRGRRSRKGLIPADGSQAGRGLRADEADCYQSIKAFRLSFETNLSLGRLSFKNNLGRLLPKLLQQSSMIGADLECDRADTGRNRFIQRRKSQLPTQKLSSKRASPVSTAQQFLCVAL
jgi:hypothetical protein